MSRSTIVSCFVAMAALIGIAASVHATSKRDSESALGRSEALIGGYHCGADETGGWQWVGLNATGDIFDKETYVQHMVPPRETPAESCEPITSVIHDSLLTAGCNVGSIRIRTDETGQSRDFSFVCHASRSSIVSLIADLAALMLEV